MGKHCSCLHSYQPEHMNASESECVSPITHNNTPISLTSYDSYHRVNTSSVSFNDIHGIYLHRDLEETAEPYDTSQIEVHRIITAGYIHEITKYCQISLPASIIEICRKYYFAAKAIRRKRVVFTSIVQLNRCIDEIPSYILNESIFLLKMNKCELLEVISEREDTEETVISSQTSGSSIRDLHPTLIRYLRKKYEEDLLLIMDGNHDWNTISKQLTSIQDTWYNCDKRYNSLRLDASYWIQDEFESKYDVDPMDILFEIKDGSLKYAPSMEILWQSNPTLIPMRSFDIDEYDAENGYNTSHIMESRQSMDNLIIPNTTMIPTASNEDLVVLSMYNSGNDFSEISYCDELSFSGSIYGIDPSNAMFDVMDGFAFCRDDVISPKSNSGCNLRLHKFVF